MNRFLSKNRNAEKLPVPSDTVPPITVVPPALVDPSPISPVSVPLRTEPVTDSLMICSTVKTTGLDDLENSLNKMRITKDISVRPIISPAACSQLPAPPPTVSLRKETVSGIHPLICFDLETTGLGVADEIIQISACGIINGRKQEFNQYVWPNRRMAPGASKVTGIRLKRGCMYHRRKKVQTCSLPVALNRFLHWLKQFPQSVLVAHNAVFDCRMLMKGCLQHNLVSFGLKKAVHGFVDTVPVMKEVFPGRDSYQQEALVHNLLGTQYQAHDAREDTTALLELIQHKDVTYDMLLKHSFTVQYAEENFKASMQKKKNLGSLETLVDNGIVSKHMAEKIAASGLCLEHLSSAVKSKGLPGMTALLQADCNGQPRVTNRSSIILQIFNHLTNQR